ncbi:MAG: hypothetical protein HY735_18665 [Verrucomicrobia bacterium]|nr:hypothetical protein [Verrucomicrobiota bacterium]
MIKPIAERDRWKHRDCEPTADRMRGGPTSHGDQEDRLRPEGGSSSAGPAIQQPHPAAETGPAVAAHYCATLATKPVKHRFHLPLLTQRGLDQAKV